MASISKDYSKPRVARAQSRYLDKVDDAYEKCLADYQAGRGVSAYYQYRHAVVTAHREFLEEVTGDPDYDKRNR